MKPHARLARVTALMLIVSLTTMLAEFTLGMTEEGADGVASTTERAAERKREERREFQSQELIARRGVIITHEAFQ